MTRVWEVKMTPKSKDASIKWIVVRVDDAENIDTYEKCLDFVEAQFPMYEIDGMLGGYKDDGNSSAPHVG